MKLKSFGCSFIFGSDLPDTDSRLPSQLTWPAHLARNTHRQYECYARPGAGNLQILEQILLQAVNSESGDLFVINWTWIDRFDWLDASSNKGHVWHTILPADKDAVAQSYYKNLHSEYKDKLTNLIYVVTAIKQCQQQGIKFIMTYMDKLLFDRRWHCNPAVENLQAQCLPHMMDFDGNNFLEWSKLQGYPISDLWHPLDQAHESAAKYMLSKNIF